MSRAALEALTQCSRDLPVENGVLPTKLCCTNRDVDAENALEHPRWHIFAVFDGPGTALEVLGQELLRARGARIKSWRASRLAQEPREHAHKRQPWRGAVILRGRFANGALRRRDADGDRAIDMESGAVNSQGLPGTSASEGYTIDEVISPEDII